MDFEFELDLDSLVEWPKYLILLFSQFNAELAWTAQKFSYSE